MIGALLTIEEFGLLATQGVPYVGELGCRIERFEPGSSRCGCPTASCSCGPAERCAGRRCSRSPTSRSMASYGVVLSLIGLVELAVTTDLNIHFLKKPRPGDLVGHGRILRLGRVLAVGEVTITRAGDEEPVAHAVGTYAIPSARASGVDSAGRNP